MVQSVRARASSTILRVDSLNCHFYTALQEAAAMSRVTSFGDLLIHSSLPLSSSLVCASIVLHLPPFSRRDLFPSPLSFCALWGVRFSDSWSAVEYWRETGMKASYREESHFADTVWPSSTESHGIKAQVNILTKCFLRRANNHSGYKVLIGRRTTHF